VTAIVCTSLICAQMASGFTMQPLSKSEPTITLAAYHQGCDGNIENQVLASGCRDVPQAKDKFYVPCKDGRLACRLVSLSNEKPDWTLPKVTITEPRRAHKSGITQPGKNGSGTATAAPISEPHQPIPQQIATQLARQGVMYAAQSKAAAAGFAAGSTLGGVGGLVVAPLASWAVCTPLKYSFIHQDWARKERWDLHPEKATGNWWYSVKMCSPLAFFFRFQEETEPHRKVLALLGGFSYSPEAYSGLVGQVAPAVPAIIDNLKFIASAFNFSGQKTQFGQQRQAYNREPWPLAIP
jgi:hypothetical protein